VIVEPNQTLSLPSGASRPAFAGEGDHGRAGGFFTDMKSIRSKFTIPNYNPKYEP
jgi:hypothetical protein